MPNFQGTRLVFDQNSTEPVVTPAAESRTVPREVIELSSDDSSESSLTSGNGREESELESPIPSTNNGIPYPRDFSQDGNQFFSRTIAVRPPQAGFLYSNQMSSKHTADKFLIQEGVFYGPDFDMLCDEGEHMDLIWSNDRMRDGDVRGLTWRCTKHNCCGKSRKSVRQDSFFFCKKTPVNNQFMAMYFWLAKCSHQTIGFVTGLHLSTIRNMIVDFRYLMEQDIKDEDIRIGGPGIIVEIDESKFGKRKYHRGSHVEGVWVVGGIERTDERRLFLTTVTDRNSSTMKDIIQRFVLPGSIIYTDCWAAYNIISQMEVHYTHYTVNHSEGFIAAQNGVEVHTNTIEGTWLGIKLRCFPRHRNKRDMPWKLIEFIWRRKHYGDMFGGMLKTLREVTLGRERGDPEWAQYVPYSLREGAEEEDIVEEEEPNNNNADEVENGSRDNDNGLEEIENQELIPFVVFPFRNSPYRLRPRSVRSRTNY